MVSYVKLPHREVPHRLMLPEPQAVYVWYWLTAVVGMPFIFGWKQFFLSSAMPFLQKTYKIDDVQITMIHFSSGLVTALSSFGYMKLSQRGCVFWQFYVLIFVGLFAGPFCLLAVVTNMFSDKSLVFFWLCFAVSGVSKGAFNVIQSQTVDFFYHDSSNSKKRHLKNFLICTSEGVGVAYGIWSSIKTENAHKDALMAAFLSLCIYSLFFVCCFFFFFIILHCCTYPGHRAWKMMSRRTTILDDKKCFSRPDSRTLLFYFLILGQTGTTFAKCGLLFWGPRLAQFTAEASSALDYYFLHVGLGWLLGAVLATGILLTLEKRGVDKIYCGTVLVASCVSFLTLSCCLLHTPNISSAGANIDAAPIAVIGIVAIAYLTLGNCLVDEAQLQLITPKTRGKWILSQLFLKESLDSFAPCLISLILVNFSNQAKKEALASAMTWPLEIPIFAALVIFTAVELVVFHKDVQISPAGDNY